MLNVLSVVVHFKIFTLKFQLWNAFLKSRYRSFEANLFLLMTKFFKIIFQWWLRVQAQGKFFFIYFFLNRIHIIIFIMLIVGTVYDNRINHDGCLFCFLVHQTQDFTWGWIPKWCWDCELICNLSDIKFFKYLAGSYNDSCNFAILSTQWECKC